MSGVLNGEHLHHDSEQPVDNGVTELVDVSVVEVSVEVLVLEIRTLRSSKAFAELTVAAVAALKIFVNPGVRVSNHCVMACL